MAGTDEVGGPGASLAGADGGPDSAQPVSAGRSLLGLLLGLVMVAAVIGTVALRIVEGIRNRAWRRRDR